MMFTGVYYTSLHTSDTHLECLYTGKYTPTHHFLKFILKRGNFMKKEKRISVYKKIWCKIRYWQSLKDISDSELAAYLQVCERTLRDYDKNARNITLEKIENFLVVTNMELSDLLSL